MPQLTVRGVEASVIAQVSAALLEDMAQLCECGTDNFTIDCLQLTAVGADGVGVVFPFVEVAWFERGREVRDQLARCIASHLSEAGIQEVEIAFKVYEQGSYYINGRSCARMQDS